MREQGLDPPEVGGAAIAARRRSGPANVQGLSVRRGKDPDVSRGLRVEAAQRYSVFFFTASGTSRSVISSSVPSGHLTLIDVKLCM